jgi:hypothetical protein
VNNVTFGETSQKRDNSIFAKSDLEEYIQKKMEKKNKKYRKQLG